MHLALRPILRLQLNMEQRLAIDTALLQRRRDLVEDLHGSSFTPRATCPNCGHPLTDY